MLNRLQATMAATWIVAPKKKDTFKTLQARSLLVWTVVFWIGAVLLSVPCSPVVAQPPGVQYAQEGESFADSSHRAAEQKATSTRRERVLQNLSSRAFAVFLAADVRNRQNDVDYEYRQNSDLLYLTGIDEPQTALILVPGGTTLDWLNVDSLKIADASRTFTQILFIRDHDPQRQLWEGAHLGVQGAERLTGIATLSIKFLPAFIQKLASQPLYDTLFTPTLPTPFVVELLSGQTVSVERAMKQFVANLNPKLVVRSPRKMLDALREIKDSLELSILRKSVAISCAGHKAVMQRVGAGWHEHEAEAVMEAEFKRLGAEDVGYPSIVGAGGNACTLHYTKNNRRAPLRDGELLLMDCGAEVNGYSADVTRTVPCSGRFSAEQRIVYNLVLEAQQAAINACRAGTDWRYPHSRAVDVIRRGLHKLGIIADTVENQYKWYFPRGSSHCIGLDVHDSQTNTTLRRGMVMTVEPGIYIPAGSPCDKRWWNIGIRIEDDILITEGAPELLSGGANVPDFPRSADEIEAFMQAARNEVQMKQAKSKNIPKRVSK
jgi:Xaa-Pro aminopeptidase